MSGIKARLRSAGGSLKRGRPDQSESQETAETKAVKKRRYSQSQEIEEAKQDNRAPDTTLDKVVVLDTGETVQNDLVKIADGLPVTGETDRNNFAVNTVKQGLEENKCNKELLENSTEARATTSSVELVQNANAEVAQPASSNTDSLNNTQTTEPVRKAHFRYDKLYRLLRSDENAQDEGIRAQNPNSSFTIHKHVDVGSMFGTQYISTSASWGAILAFARLKHWYPKKIATIDVAKLEDCGGVTFIDLTNESMRQRHLNDQLNTVRARKYQEVLITGVIPASCIIDITTINMPDSNSD